MYMEEMNEQSKMQLTDEVVNYVESIGKWYRFFGIVLIICAVLLLFFAVMLFTMPMQSYASYGYDASDAVVSNTVIGFVYILAIGFYIPVIVFLFRGARAANAVVMTPNNDADLVDFLKHTRSFWKYTGILTIIGFALSILGFFMGMLSAL